MAKILYGGGVAEMRGSEAGTTHSRNRGGSYTRQRVTPLNPNSTFQSEQRSIVSDLAKAWGADLTSAQRDQWQGFADLFPLTDVFGAAIVMTGEQAYIRLNTRLLAAGLAAIDTPPASQDVTDVTITSGTFDIGAGSVSLVFTPTPLPAGNRLQLSATPGLSPGISYVKNRMRLFTTQADATASPVDFEAEWTARFGALPLVGQKVVVEARTIRAANGAISVPQRIDLTVVST